MFVDRAVGIDLGTTNSEIALLDPSEKDIIVYADRFGRKTIPSAVAWDPKKQVVLVGRAARNRRGKTPGPIESIKRKMGRDETVQLGPEALLPEAISAKILEALRSRMREHLQDKAGDVEVRVARAVITVPAYFDAPQVEATRRAGELAGLEVLGVLQEPTAAAIYHAWRRKLGDGCYLVYDLGGGTFDVSILRCLAGEYQVLAIDGDNFLGGDDFDRRFADVLRQKLVAQGYALELDVAHDEEDRERFSRLVHLAQSIKESLSTKDVVLVSEQGILEDKDGESVDFEGDIGRAEYDAAIADLVEGTIESCRRALSQSAETAGVTLSDIKHIVLVGGSTRVPHVIERVIESLCKESQSEVPLQDEVDTCVALGAAIHAALLGGLRIGDDDAQFCVRGPLVGQGASLRLTLDIEKAPDGVSALEVRDDDETLATVEFDGPTAEGLRLEVPLSEAEASLVKMTFVDDAGDTRATLPLALYRGDVRPRASSLSQPSVIAKDISVEVLRAGRRDRRVLLSRGTGLPAEAQHTFYTGDRSGAVVLRLLQNRLPIKTLALAVDPELPVGTPVELTLACDDAMRLEARAVVAGQELWANIEPAPQKSMNIEEVEALLGRADAASRALWGHDASYFRREVEPLVTGIREVLGTDLDKLSALSAKLEQLLEAFAGTGDGLNPPMERFEDVMDALRRTVYRNDGSLLGMDSQEWEARIEELLQRAGRAWEDRDAGAWRRLYNEAQALQETASEQEFSRMKLDDPAYVMRRLVGAIGRAKRVEHGLSDFVPSASDEVRAIQIAERDRLLGVLQEKVIRPLEGVNLKDDAPSAALDQMRKLIDIAGSELDRVGSALERLPALGVVTERG